MRPFGIIGIVAAFAVIISLLNSFFIVDQRQQSVVLRFGAVERVFNVPGEDDAGLKFKVPFAENVVTYDKRNLGLDVPDIEVFASNQEQLIVDAFVRWKISNPVQFYQRLTTQREAQNQLLRFTDTAIRNALGSEKPENIISGQRSELMDQIRESLSAAIAGRGIEIIDVRIKRVDLPIDVSQQVFRRMAETRNQQAEQIRAQGDERAKLVRARAERKRTVLLAEARCRAEEIRGSGDATRNRIYAEAYDQNKEFFRFQRALIACEEAFTGGTRFVVGPNQLGLCDEFITQAQINGRSNDRPIVGARDEQDDASSCPQAELVCAGIIEGDGSDVECIPLEIEESDEDASDSTDSVEPPAEDTGGE